jgi:hypothetical protein
MSPDLTAKWWQFCNEISAGKFGFHVMREGLRW